MCIAAYNPPVQHLRGYPAAKKRRPSYGEDCLCSHGAEALANCSPVGSDDSTQTSCSYAAPVDNVCLHPRSHNKPVEPVALVHAAVAAEPRPAAGWFSKCRGCGCKTAHELELPECAIPLCVRCQLKVGSLQGDSHTAMVANLAYVHKCWEQLGL